MKDVTGRELNRGDVVICTDYNQCGLYMGIVEKVDYSSVRIKKSKTWSITKKSENHICIVGDDAIQAFTNNKNLTGVLFIKATNLTEAIKEFRNSS